MLERVFSTIQKYNLIKDGEKVIVGLSGGPDSVCLLHVLHRLSDRLKAELFAIHINHMLRGEEAQGDERYVRKLCKELGIHLFVEAFDIKNIAKEQGVSLEEAGRNIRYQQFEALAASVGASKIAVAHNRNDQAETVLMRIIRGTGLDGLKAMDHKRDLIIRPLLDIDRAEIEVYCSKNMLNPRIDSSNLQKIYTRNKIRLELVPEINRLFQTDITDSIHKMSLLIREDYDFIQNTILGIYNECIVKESAGSVWLDGQLLEKNHIAAVRRVFRACIKKVKGDLKEIENIHIDSVIDLLRFGRTGAQIHLPGGLRASKSYNIIKVFIQNNSVEKILFNEDLNIPGITEADTLNISIQAYIEAPRADTREYFNIPDTSSEQFFDYDSVQLGISMRNRREGDIFKPLRSSGTKKLKEYFIDRKISRDQRDKIPLIAKNNEIVWIIGYKISDKFKVTENTKSVLRLKFKVV